MYVLVLSIHCIVKNVRDVEIFVVILMLRNSHATTIKYHITGVFAA